MPEIAPVAIIGAGPAGSSAAIQLKRLGIEPYIVDKKGLAGGLIENANSIDNYLGIQRYTNGVVIAEQIRNHLAKIGINVSMSSIVEVKKHASHYELICENGSSILANIVVIAVGTVPKKLENINFDENKIFYDFVSIKNSSTFSDIKNILIIGGGEASFDYALSLVGEGKDVFIAVRSSEPRAHGSLRKKVEECNKIKIMYNVTPSDALGHLANIDAVMVAIGRESNLKIMKYDYNNDPNTFIIGDARLGSLGQLGIAVGDGLSCAEKIASKFRRNN